jgi:hypothetical protein
VTARPGTYRIPRPAPPPDDARDDGRDDAPDDGRGAAAVGSPPRAQLCTYCGAVATHYLTCPSLQLPAGYRPGRDAGSAAPVPLASGPHHPDWPLPPRR